LSSVACSDKPLTFGKMQMLEHVRIDKWLWAVRLYKSRSLATSACNAGHVKVGGQSVKPSRQVHVGEVISARSGRIQRTVQVLALLDQRVAATRVPNYLHDQTSPEEYARAREEAKQAPISFPRGFGRPTKRQRRQLDQLRETGAS